MNGVAIVFNLGFSTKVTSAFQGYRCKSDISIFSWRVTLITVTIHLKVYIFLNRRFIYFFDLKGADLVKRLLTLEPEKRLGFTDICDHVCYKSIKSHPYFRLNTIVKYFSSLSKKGGGEFLGFPQ